LIEAHTIKKQSKLKNMAQFEANALYNAQGERVYSVGETPTQIYRMKGDINHTTSQELIPFIIVSNLKLLVAGNVEFNNVWSCDLHPVAAFQTWWNGNEMQVSAFYEGDETIDFIEKHRTSNTFATLHTFVNMRQAVAMYQDFLEDAIQY